MANVVRLSHHRSVSRRDLPLHLGAGDRDLIPVAGILWLVTMARVLLAALHHEVFGAEVTFALLCAVLLPWFALKARNHHETRKQ